MDLMQMSQKQNQCVKTQFWKRRGSGYKWQKIRNNNYRDLKTSSQRKRRKRVSVNARQILTLLYLMFLKQFDNTLPSLSLYTQIWFLYFFADNPQFTIKLHDRYYKPGDKMALSCHVTSSSTISVSWFQNEELISDGKRMKTTLSEDGIASLVISSAKAYDDGIYKCTARNKTGKSSTYARVMVGGKNVVHVGICFLCLVCLLE